MRPSLTRFLTLVLAMSLALPSAPAGTVCRSAPAPAASFRTTAVLLWMASSPRQAHRAGSRATERAYRWVGGGLGRLGASTWGDYIDFSFHAPAERASVASLAALGFAPLGLLPLLTGVAANSQDHYVWFSAALDDAQRKDAHTLTLRIAKGGWATIEIQGLKFRETNLLTADEFTTQEFFESVSLGAPVGRSWVETTANARASQELIDALFERRGNVDLADLARSALEYLAPRATLRYSVLSDPGSPLGRQLRIDLQETKAPPAKNGTSFAGLGIVFLWTLKLAPAAGVAVIAATVLFAYLRYQAQTQNIKTLSRRSKYPERLEAFRRQALRSSLMTAAVGVLLGGLLMSVPNWFQRYEDIHHPEGASAEKQAGVGNRLTAPYRPLAAAS